MRLIYLLAIFGVLLAPSLGENSMEKYLRRVLENFRGQMKTGIPELNMPVMDPLSVPSINTHIKERTADVQLNINNFIATGLSTFNVQEVKFDLFTTNLKLKILLPKGDGRAKYDIDGNILRLIPVYGKGNAGFVINDLLIDADAKVDIFSSGKPNIKDFKIQLSFKKIEVYLENILGGGELGDLVNQIINGFGKAIFDGQRSNLENMLNGVIRQALNRELAKIDIGKIGYAQPSPAERALFSSANANHFVDQILGNVRPELKKYDPVVLPNQKDGFKEKVGFITFEGFAELTNGRCYGLSTLHRAGGVKLSTNIPAGTVTVEGHLGINNLRINYNVYANFLGIKAYPKIGGIIRKVTVYIKVTQNLRTGKSQLDGFRIENIDRPALSVRFVPVLDFIISGAANLAIRPIVNNLRGSIEREIRNLLAREIGKVNIRI